MKNPPEIPEEPGGVVIGLFLGTLIGLRHFRSRSGFLILVTSMLLFPVVVFGGVSEISSAREFGGAIVAVMALAFLSGFGFVMPASAALACVMVRWTFLRRQGGLHAMRQSPNQTVEATADPPRS